MLPALARLLPYQLTIGALVITTVSLTEVPRRGFLLSVGPTVGAILFAQLHGAALSRSLSIRLVLASTLVHGLLFGVGLGMELPEAWSGFVQGLVVMRIVAFAVSTWLGLHLGGKKHRLAKPS